MGLALAAGGCSASDASSDESDEGALETQDAPAPAELRRELRVLQRDEGTNAWLANEPSSVDGRPIGTDASRMNELFVRLLDTLKGADARPAVLAIAATFGADGSPMRQKFASLFVSFPTPIAVQVTKATDPQFLAPRVIVGHDMISRSCDLTPDGSCAEGRYYIPLDDPDGSYVAKQPFAAALVAATDAAARHATSGADGIPGAMAKLQKHAKNFDTRTDDGTGNFVPERTRVGIPFEKRTVTRYGIHEVLTSARVREDLRGRVVVIVGEPNARRVALYGGAEPAEEVTVAPAAQLAPLIADP